MAKSVFKMKEDVKGIHKFTYVSKNSDNEGIQCINKTLGLSNFGCKESGYALVMQLNNKTIAPTFNNDKEIVKKDDQYW